MLFENIKKLVEYGIQTGLTPECERIYTTNLLLEIFKEDNYEDAEIDAENLDLEDILKNLLDEAVSRTHRGQCCIPRPLRHKAYELPASKTGADSA